jgi:hypothetical protein
LRTALFEGLFEGLVAQHRLYRRRLSVYIHSY